MEPEIYRKHAFAMLHLIESAAEAEKACNQTLYNATSTAHLNPEASFRTSKRGLR